MVFTYHHFSISLWRTSCDLEPLSQTSDSHLSHGESAAQHSLIFLLQNNPEMSERKEEESLISSSEISSDCDGGEEEPETGGWYGWLVVAASFTCVCVLDGVGYSYGIFLQPLLQEFDQGRGILSIAGSLQVGVYGLSSPLVSRLVERWGERKVAMLGALVSCLGLLLASLAQGIKTLLLCYSLVTGLGFGLMYLPSVVIPSKYFTTRRSLATGVVLCAAGVGTFLLAPLSQTLLDTWGWRGAMRGLALTSAACLGCGALMVPPASTSSPAGPRPGSSSITSITSSPALSVFLMLGLADMLSTLSLYMPYTHLPSAVEARGLTSSQAASLISSVGVSSSLGRLLAGWLSDQTWAQPGQILAGAITAATPCLFLLAL